MGWVESEKVRKVERGTERKGERTGRMGVGTDGRIDRGRKIGKGMEGRHMNDISAQISEISSHAKVKSLDHDYT